MTIYSKFCIFKCFRNSIKKVDFSSFLVIPAKAFSRDYGITGVRLSVCLFGRGTLGILLFIAGRGRKAYWKRGVGGEGEGAEPIQ